MLHIQQQEQQQQQSSGKNTFAIFLSGPIVVAAPRLEVRLAGLADEALLWGDRREALFVFIMLCLFRYFWALCNHRSIESIAKKAKIKADHCYGFVDRPGFHYCLEP